VRSGIGLSQDNTTLFYFCGLSLSMEMLAKAMQAAGAWNTIQLDINGYWALFVKFQPSGTKADAGGAAAQSDGGNIDQYLWNYSRDYFFTLRALKNRTSAR